MSGGEQQMVAVARARVSAPRLLMPDEPSLGLAPKLVDELLAAARRIAGAGTTGRMVEQNVKKALAAADRGCVLERGALLASGSARLLARSTVVREAYLGAAAAATPSAADAARHHAGRHHAGRHHAARQPDHAQPGLLLVLAGLVADHAAHRQRPAQRQGCRHARAKRLHRIPSMDIAGAAAANSHVCDPGNAPRPPP